ncbi:MAG TPA: isovaleryl-CoA dehydrogenase [Roseobacter sp.]|jgi:isovaleryl-CoA dehydrogenase|uniref:Acyl-CoA dehydrogenase n=2 Tax=root TaxID=1 RepID=A0A221K8P1_9RHOB|nr:MULTISPECIES: acyl-CoA dehydrogenase family protein [Roseobacteraceae]ASM75374.1 acyl-CoA dehydrogenase [Pseudosulfitobacter pseudonitzschiae]HDZ80558.1 isovaleryl-CoA dehydrogenase [Roseobacter sp.]|tara:strand:+ start:2993 stop:4186 length:1194 start_codon:yes stop_codon:yes gene_type:complete
MTTHLRDNAPSHFVTTDQQALADQAYRFFQSEFHHLNAEMDDTDDLPASVFPKLGEMGYLGLNVSPEYGGAGLDFTSACVITEELSRANAAIGLSQVAHDNLCVNNIYRNANDELRRKFLPGLCEGKLIGALGLTEPGAGSDALGSMRTTARKDGGDYVLNGTKIYITNGPIADIVLVYAKTSPEKGAKGISAFIVEAGTPGFKVAQKLNKMGFRGSPTGELVFDECRVPVENMVGLPDTGVAITMSGLDLERAIVCFNAMGIARRALEISIDYAKTRQQFGKPIASFQMVQGMLADMYTEIEVARTLSFRTAAMCEGLEEGAGGRGEIHKLTAAAVFKAAAATSFVLDRAVQIHGGAGYMRDTEVNRLYRTGRVLEVGAGTQEVRKLIISGELLKN